MSAYGPSVGAVATMGPTPPSQPCSSYSTATPTATRSNISMRSPNFTERHRLLAALRERAAETAAAVACTRPRPGANGLCPSLMDEHSSLLRCLNILEDSGDEMNMAVPPLKMPDEMKTVKKHNKRKPKRNQGEASTQLAITNERYPNTIPRNRRKSKTTTNVLRPAKPKIQISSQRELLSGQENVKQRPVKSNVKKKSADNQKSYNLPIKGQKLVGDKKKKIQKSGSAKKVKTTVISQKNVPQTQSSMQIAIPDEKRQVKQRRMKLQKSSRESMELALTPFDKMYQELNPGAEGEGPKRLPRRAKRIVNKTCTITVSAPIMHRKPEARKVPITPRKGNLKHQPPKVKNKGSLKGKSLKGEYPLRQFEEKNDSNLEGVIVNQTPNKDQLEEYSFDARNVCPIAVAPMLSTVKISSKSYFDSPSVILPSVESKQSQNSDVPETRETCLRSILRDANKKLVSIGSKTVRFFEDTLPPKKCKKRKTKCTTKKSVLTDKPMGKRFARPNLNVSPPKETVVGFGRATTPTKNTDSFKKKKRGKATTKEKRSLRNLLTFPNESELLEDTKENSVVEVTPLKQKKSFGQVKTTEGKTDFPRTRSEEVLGVLSAKDLPSNTPSKTNSITSDSWRISTKDSNLRPENRKSLNKLLSLDDSHTPNALALRCQRRSLRDMTKRYSTFLDDINRAKDHTDPGENISKTSMKSHVSMSEDLPKTKPAVTSFKRRSTDITKDLNMVNRNPGPKPAIFTLGNNSSTRHMEDDKFAYLRTSHRKSLSQTSFKNGTRMINSDHILTSSNSNTRSSRMSLDSPMTSRCQKMNLRYLGTRRDLGNNLSRSVSTSQTSTRCKLGPKDSRALYESHKNNFFPSQDKSHSSHNWQKRIRSEDPRLRYIDNNSPKWLDGVMPAISPQSHPIFVGRTTRKKSGFSGINKTKAPESKLSHDTIKMNDEVYFFENPTSDGDSTIGRPVNTENGPYVHLANIENNPAFIHCKSPKFSYKSGLKHTPLKYIFQVITGEPFESLTPKNNKSYSRSKNKRHEGQRQKSAGTSETEDEGSRVHNVSERSDSSRKSRNRPVKTKKQKMSGSKTNFHKNILYSSEIDEESASSRKSPTQHSRNIMEENQVPPTFVASANRNSPSSRRSSRKKMEYFELTQI